MASLILKDTPQSKASPRISVAAWHSEFRVLPWLRSGHAQTLVGNFWRRQPFTLASEAIPVVVDQTNNSRVLTHCHWQPQSVRASRLTLVLLHGLEGSSNSRYITGITALAWAAGCNIIRMNMRNCGGTESWTPTLYHSALSGDVAAVLQHFVAQQALTRVALVGYSMGGNLVLKCAGEFGESHPDWLRAVVGVSPVVDLAESADALHDPQNRLYEWHFLRNLMSRFRRKAQLFPEIYGTRSAPTVRSIREFDDLIMAPFSGFAGADDYYYRAASARVVGKIAIPTLILHALDDPFIRLTPATRVLLETNPWVTLLESAHGGHCAFLGQTDIAFFPASRHWAEATLIRFLMAQVGHAHGS
ncbi:YheT family hydrolase [Acidicapsa dinghuensis]|uniref:YheT family hydrolase n=1 Tax=Acidicapsa dinghuensis TaxID=2218256 RepID=A0ABW1EGE5_9BACT|nr:alpha/beta fold hydrolase [Acidicapsa dinghuensis]